MYRFFGEYSAYSLVTALGFAVTLITSLFYFRSKQKAKSLYSDCLITIVSKKNSVLGKILEVILLSLESVILVLLCDFALVNLNRPFGELVGTGANYFGALLGIPVIWFIFCAVLVINPLKQIDIATMNLPLYLFFIKLSCFFNGCCWGIPWEYGLYNSHPDHPGKQVPVQLFEALWGLLIFFILLKYRKKAKPGTVFPVYMILYSATRFCSEFFRREENVFWIFKTYHLLCLAGIALGVIYLFIVKRFGDKIQAAFEIPYKKLESLKEQKALKLAEEKAQAEAAEAERLEKIRRSRQKAKARKK